MPSRPNKRQLREQEELLNLRPTEEEPDFDGEEMPSGVERSTMVRRPSDCATCKQNDTRKFGTLAVEDLEEEDPVDRSSKPKKVCAPAAAYLPTVRLIE